MKKIKNMKLMLLGLLAMGSISVSAQEKATTVFRYTQTGTSATINGFVADYEIPADGVVTIPAKVKDPNSSTEYTVSAIKSEAFKGNTKIKKVVIATTELTTIGSAFEGCSNLTEIDLSKCGKVTTISAGAFKGTGIVNLDLSGTKLTSVGALFGTVFGDAGTKLTTTAAVEAYNDALPNAISTFMNKPYTKETANKQNQTLHPECVVKDDPRKFTADEAAEYNAGLDGALGANVELSTFELMAYNTYATNNSKPTKTAPAKLTKAEAIAYNASLTGAKSAGDNYVDKNGIAVNYTDDTAYEHNMSLDFTDLVAEGDESSTAYTPAEVRAFNDDATKNPGALKLNDTDPTTVVAEVKNTTLKSVTLPATCTEITEGAFQNCTALATLPFVANLTTLGAKALLGTALTSLDFSGTKVTSIPADLIIDQDKVKENTTLKSVKLNTGISSIAANTFKNCSALDTVEFPDYEAASKPFTSIGSEAFAYTAIAAIEIPNVMPADAPNGVAASAFAGCEALKSFTYLPKVSVTKEVVNNLAFPGCSDVIYYTSNDNVSYYETNSLTAPKNTTMQIKASGSEIEFTTNEYKKTAGKYYVKYIATADIKIKASEGKVYNAYLDDATYTLNMCLFKSSGGYYNIKNGQIVLIITNNKDLQYEKQTGAPKTGAWIDDATTTPPAVGKNALQIVTDKDGISRASLDALASTLSFPAVVYGWVNSEKAGTGWQKITSGKTFKQGTMYILAAEPASGARLNVRWLDENGNVEDETTAIESIQNVSETENGEIYNLQGVRVNGTQKGIFIKNGKKFIVK